MADNGSLIANLAKEGIVSLEDLQAKLGTTSNGVVTVEDWGITYNSNTGQLSEYCTVIANNPDNPITGIGMIAYSADGSTMYMLQYTNGFSSLMVAPSIGTNLYKTSMGNQALCVVYGWTQNGSFYFPQTMTIQMD